MSITGQNVRIIVNEPFEWKHGNLFGHVVKQRGNILFVKLSKPIQVNTLISDLMELRPRYQGDTFKPLDHLNSVTVGGTLIHPETDERDYVLIGTIVMD